MKRLWERFWTSQGPLGRMIVVLVIAALVGGLTVAGYALWPWKCPGDLVRAGDQCVGVSVDDPDGDPELAGLIGEIAAENKRVEREWTEPEDGSPVPFVRVALMIPYRVDASSTMTLDQIKRALGGAHAAQLRANAPPGDPQFQLLMANIGKDIRQWKPAVDQLAALVDGESPLVGTFGMPSSTPETKAMIDALTELEIPAVSPVVTSTDMKADYFFKTSPSNASLVHALKAYLDEHPGRRTGYLVTDNRQKDNYSLNLRNAFRDVFQADYGLDRRVGSFLGQIGDPAGMTRRFSQIAQEICLYQADTIFFAGRDRDLPFLVGQLADEHLCDDAGPMRILKVGIGFDPMHTTDVITKQLQSTDITLVGAAAVSPDWWAEDAQRRPDGLDEFLTSFEPLKPEYDQDLGNEVLADGYAIMYHDAFMVLRQAVNQALRDLNENVGAGGGGELKLPKKDDIYNTIINMNVLGGGSDVDCVNCVHGASGTFGFGNAPQTEQWAVCKPVPVIRYPKVPGTAAGMDVGTTYRTHTGTLAGGCP